MFKVNNIDTRTTATSSNKCELISCIICCIKIHRRNQNHDKLLRWSFLWEYLTTFSRLLFSQKDPSQHATAICLHLLTKPFERTLHFSCSVFCSFSAISLLKVQCKNIDFFKFFFDKRNSRLLKNCIIIVNLKYKEQSFRW